MSALEALGLGVNAIGISMTAAAVWAPDRMRAAFRGWLVASVGWLVMFAAAIIR